MKTRFALIFGLLWLCCGPSIAQTSAEALGQVPLNLSLPREAGRSMPALAGESQDRAGERPAAASEAKPEAAWPRYGTGFEARQHGFGMGFGQGDAGLRGGGRGGMGRGRW